MTKGMVFTAKGDDGEIYTMVIPEEEMAVTSGPIRVLAKAPEVAPTEATDRGERLGIPDSEAVEAVEAVLQKRDRGEELHQGEQRLLAHEWNASRCACGGRR